MDDYDTARQRLRGQPADASEAGEALGQVHAVFAESNTAEPPGPAELLAALTVLRYLRQELATWEPQLITAAREQGVSWASLAPALGVTSRQAAERRYLRLRPSDTGEPTGEGRVLAERTRRAGDRAVAEWARENSAILRQLAGQVSALEGLTGPARRQADRVYQALTGNDPTTLLSPLADAHTHLEKTHTNLADQIKNVTDHTEQLRRHPRTRH
jgi:hypothetical protein